MLTMSSEVVDEVNPEAYRAIVFNAARDGNLKRLCVFLGDRSTEWIRSCISSQNTATPPIVIASRNGHLDVVKYLLVKGANVSVTGNVSFDGEEILGSPALWAAAAAGHFDIVRLLIETGEADINQTTQSNSSPLRGACYDGHFVVVKYLVEKGADIELANRHGHTPLMIASFKLRTNIVRFLLDHGANPCATSVKGNTALHDAAEAGSNKIVKMLLQAGAKNVKDDSHVTPMMCAAVAGHENIVMTLSEIADPQETRDALKILGATLVDKKMDLDGAVRVWTRALTYGEPMRSSMIFDAYDYLTEIDSEEDIEHISGDPDTIRMQALIVRERILGGAHHETHYFIRYRGAMFCDMGQVNRCVLLWLHALDLQQTYLCALHPSTISTFSAFADTFMLTINDGIINANNDGGQVVRISRCDVYKVLDRAVYELDRFAAGDERIREEEGLDSSYNEYKCMEFLMLTCLQLILLIRRLHPEKKSPPDHAAPVDHFEMNLMRIIGTFVELCKYLKLYPLHAACLDIDKPITSRFPSAPVISLLLRAGVDVNKKDQHGNTALHVLMMNPKPRPSIIKILLENGAALLARNTYDETCLELISDKLPRAVKQLKLGRYITLVGLTANVIQRNLDLDFCRRYLPAHLVPVIELH